MVEVNRKTTPANMRWKLVDRDTGAENAQIDWTFRVGDQVKLRLVNEMDSDHPMPHPFHVHGAGRFLILARDDVVEPNLVWKDTVLVRTGETVDILLDVTNPGRWMAHCHIAEHHESGMMFSFNVDAGSRERRRICTAGARWAASTGYMGTGRRSRAGGHAACVLVARYGDRLRARACGDRLGLHRFRRRRRTPQRFSPSKAASPACSSSSPPQRSQAHRGCSSSVLPATDSRTSGSTAVSLLPTPAGGLRSVLWSIWRSRQSSPSRSSPAFTFTTRGRLLSDPQGGIYAEQPCHPFKPGQRSLNRAALSATVHCLTGCAIGEVLGMVLATWWGWGNAASIVLAVALAFCSATRLRWGRASRRRAAPPSAASRLCVGYGFDRHDGDRRQRLHPSRPGRRSTPTSAMHCSGGVWASA